MWPSYHGTTSPSTALTRLRQTLDALKQSAKILFAPQNQWHENSVLNDATVPPLNVSYAEDGEYSTAHLSRVAIIAASLGIEHIYAIPLPPLWLLPRLRGELLAHPTPSVRPSPYDFNLDLDIEAILHDGVLHSRTPTLLAYSAKTLFASTLHASSASSLNGGWRPNGNTAHDPITVPESPSLSTTSTPYASSSSADSDSSFEVASPSTNSVAIPASLELLSDGLDSVPDCAEEYRLVSNNDTFSRRIEAEVLALACRLGEEARQKALDGGPQTTAAANPDDANPISEPESPFDDGAADGLEASHTTSAPDVHGYDSTDAEGALILSSLYSGEEYTLEGVIARGGSARVVRAVDSKGQRRAVKIVLKQKVFTWRDARENLLREKDIMARVAALDTWRLAYLYESWEDEDMIFFVMVSIT